MIDMSDMGTDLHMQSQLLNVEFIRATTACRETPISELVEQVFILMSPEAPNEVLFQGRGRPGSRQN